MLSVHSFFIIIFDNWLFPTTRTGLYNPMLFYFSSSLSDCSFSNSWSATCFFPATLCIEVALGHWVCGFPALGGEGAARLLSLTGLSSDAGPAAVVASGVTPADFPCPPIKLPYCLFWSVLCTLWLCKLRISSDSVDCSLCFLEDKLSVWVGCTGKWARFPPALLPSSSLSLPF